MDISENLPLEEPEGFRKDILYLGLTLMLSAAVVAVGNLTTPDDRVEVGTVEVFSQCQGFEAGDMCIGIQVRDHRTFNYENWTDAEPGTEDFYRRVEAELMMKAYNTCDEDMSGMEWTSQVSYMNRTGAEWSENENVTLLPCERTFYRDMKQNS